MKLNLHNQKRNLLPQISLGLLLAAAPISSATPPETDPKAKIEIGIKVEDPSLKEFLGKIKTTVEKHDWPAYLGLCSPIHYKGQTGTMKQPLPQYIIESLGMGYHNNNTSMILPKDIRGFKALDRIQEITFSSLEPAESRSSSTGPNANRTVKGKIKFENGKSLDLSLFIVPRKTGGFAISGAVG